MAVLGSSNKTADQQDRRRLVAVLYADMAGYNRLIGLDDQGTLKRLRAPGSYRSSYPQVRWHIIGHLRTRCGVPHYHLKTLRRLIDWAGK